MTDMLFSSARLRMSRAQQKAVLSWARDLGATVPSYDHLRKCQRQLLRRLGEPTKRHVSIGGNIWYLNDIGLSVAKVGP